MFLLEFHSADDYAMIIEGKKYNTLISIQVILVIHEVAIININIIIIQYKVYGYWFRLPFMSWFPKIYKYKEV